MWLDSSTSFVTHWPRPMPAHDQHPVPWRPRRVTWPVWGGALLAAAAAGCGSTVDGAFCDEATCTFSADEWRWIRSLSPIPAVPADPSNQFRADPRAAALGEAFYFDAHFSGPATQVDALG